MKFKKMSLLTALIAANTIGVGTQANAQSMTSLGTLGGSYSNAYAVSADGRVIVGASQTGSGDRHAFKYSGSTMTSLGTLGGSYSNASAVSADGGVIVGASETGSGDEHAFIYRNKVEPSNMVDVNNTYKALGQTSSQLNSLINLQSMMLVSALNHDCTQFGDNNVCVAVGSTTNSVTSNSSNQTTGNLRAAYRFSPNFRVGVFADQSFAVNTPSNYSLNQSQPWFGMFAGWKEASDSGLSARASIGYGSQGATITRQVLANTEAGKGNSNLNGLGGQVDVRYGIPLNSKVMVQPFVGLRIMQVDRGSY
jgi:probable HAF family extracellular repeat protein